jgi:signal transduction histidine kinase
MRRELEGRPYAAAFLRDAWHDLKTPAAAIKATVELLEDGALEDPEAAGQFLENLRRSSEQLERTIADLVTLARFETSTLAQEETGALDSLSREALDAVRPIADACHVQLALRALSNLLDNAINATHKGRVEIVLDDQDPSCIHIDVINEPAEVPAEVRDRLFERAATSRKGSGSGLGLAIARAAVEAHGGRIRFVELGPPRVRVRLDLPR